MRIVDRYIFREYGLHLFYCVLALAMVFVVYDLFGHLGTFLEARTPVHLIGYFYVCMLAQAMEFLLPASLLLATLYTLWHMTRHNEFTAMRACGISMLRLMSPFLMVGVAASLCTAAVKEGFAPEASLWASEFAKAKFRETRGTTYEDVAYYNTLNHRVWLIGKVNSLKPNILMRVTIIQDRPDGTRAWALRAKDVMYLDGQWWVNDVTEVQLFDERGNPLKTAIPWKDPSMPRELRFLNERPSELLAELRPWEFLSSADIARYLSCHPGLSGEAITDRKFDLHSRLAMPWACLVVTLFGVPAGARCGRQSPLGGLFMALVFFFAYYLLIHVGVFVGKRGIVEPWLGAWLPNGASLAAGVLMLFRLR